STLVQQSGLGPYDAPTLARRLADQVTAWDATIGADSVTASVEGSPRHAAMLFELLHLAFVAPRIDSAAVAKWRSTARQQGLGGEQIALLRATTQRNPRARPVVGALADSVDPQTALAFYRASFADAGHFTFVIVGDFTVDSLRPLVTQYIGGLPGHPDPVPYRGRDLGIRPPTGIVRLAVAGADSMSTTRLEFLAEVPPTLQEAMVMRAMEAVLWQRLFLRLRQQMSGVYSPAAQSSLEPLPYGHAVSVFQFTCAPERVEELQRALFAVIDSVTTYGVTAQEGHTVQTMLRRQHAVDEQENVYWTNLLFSTVLLGQSLDALAAWEQQVPTVTPEMIGQTARQLLKQQRYVLITTLPVRLLPMRRDEMREAQQW
ncbi:MAG TPA: insulinase family protein, partial [Gemmatimonadaceae bacterium]|nr:insulinase family protein [Gemmatimonadaceae bacterium]